MARHNSSRLEGKVYKKIIDKKIIEYCISNSKKIRNVNEIIIATTNSKKDKKMHQIAKKNNVKVFFGSEKDVVKRYVDAAKKYNLDIIIRITGDCPFVSSEVLDIMLRSHLKKNSDYTVPRRATLGSAGEVISFKALTKLNKFMIKKNIDYDYREYVKFYFLSKKFQFKKNIISLPRKFLSNFRLTLDYKSDLLMFNILVKNLKKKQKDISLINIISFLKKNKNIANINIKNDLIYEKPAFLKKINYEINR